MSKLSYRLGFALLVLPACSNPAPADTDSTSDTSTSTSTTTDTTAGPTSEPPTTSTTDGPTTTSTSTTEGPTTEPVTSTTSTTSTDTTDSSTTTEGTTTTTTSSTSTTDTSTTDGPDQCADGEKNGSESDTDCGGPACPACPDGNACVEPTDCESLICVDATCSPPPVGCIDGEKNNEETDIDCGGSECQPCADDLACGTGDDCLSKVCTDEVCQAASCTDEVQNGEESDVDCGGLTCGKCVDGDTCNSGNDCDSGVCENGVCSPTSCEDSVKNADETDVDCGGPECDPCGDGLACGSNDDCNSNICEANLCVGTSCEDGIQNGQETDVDCGGPDCGACPGLGLVINEVDYDNLNADNAEYIELLNTTADPIALAGHAVVLVNGSDSKTYATIDLTPAGTIAPGQYLVIAKPSFVVPAEALKVAFNGDMDKIQNGGPDGIALVGGGVLIDALSYEGAMTNITIAGVGMVSLVEGTVLPAMVADSNTVQGSLARIPDGSDTNDAATDWKFTATLTPGVANVP